MKNTTAIRQELIRSATEDANPYFYVNTDAWCTADNWRGVRDYLWMDHRTERIRWFYLLVANAI